MRDLFSFLLPDFEYHNLFEIDRNIFSGKELLIFDVDNTIFFSETTESTDEIIKWFTEVKNNSACVFVSNSRSINKRKKLITEKTGCNIFVTKRKKPSKKLFDDVISHFSIDPKNIVVLGDRIFTDVLFGNLRGATTILLDPLSSNEYLFIKFFRLVERSILKISKFLNKKIMLNFEKDVVGIDMHIHTEYSKDSFGNIKKYLQIAKEKNFGLAITDHNEIDGAVYAVKNNNGVLVIPGIEVKAFNGIDVLVYFYTLDDLISYYDKYILPRKIKDDFVLDITVEEIVSFAKMFKSVVVAPHPFEIRECGFGNVLINGITSEEIMKQIDGVETLNGVNTVKRNLRAVEWIKKYDVTKTGGSDAHAFFDVGRVLTQVKHDKEHILDSLLYNETKVVEFKHRTVLPIILFILGQFKLLTYKNGWKRFKKHIITCVSLKGRIK